MTDPIKYEIQQLQNKIAELELEEENAKKQTFGYYFDKLFEFIKTKNDAVNEEFSMRQRYRSEIIQTHNAEYVPALEHIYRALYVINERLTKLEDK
jgi:hypothetical protein